MGKLQGKLRDGQLSTQEHHNLLKQELSRRDETIQQLRREVLHLQEKRDHAQVEVGGTEYLAALYYSFCLRFARDWRSIFLMKMWRSAEW